MPGSTGGRTPDAPDRGVCAISPSDLVGYTGNALNRIKELEQRVAELEAGNVTANQLSDLAQQIGWASVTYLGQPGWTQTEYGTLIPPAGWSFLGAGMTLSDGNVYQGVFYDEDGVLQFGFNKTTGTVTGANVSGYNYLICQANTTVLSSGNPNLSVLYSSGSGIFTQEDIGSGTIHILQKGLYRADAHSQVNLPTSSGGFALMRVRIYKESDDSLILAHEDYVGWVTGANGNQSMQSHFSFYVSVPAYIEYNFFGVTNLANVDKSIFSIEKVG
jgi:hypothetical protein